MIVSWGETVVSAAVENAGGEYAAVAAGAVIGGPDSEWGTRPRGDRSEAGRAGDVGRPAGAVRAVPHTYRVPPAVEWVDRVPLSGSGKRLRCDLRAPHWSQTGRAVK
jgi:fatty-acyl-CoA synthase